jgi:hypothetical protein
VLLLEYRRVMTKEDEARMNALAVAANYADLADAYFTAAMQIIERYQTAFPTTALILTTTSNPFPTNGDFEQASLVEWAKGNFAGQFGTMTASLHATLPPHDGPPALPSISPLGDQPIFSTLDQDRLYLPAPKPDPWPASPQPCDDLLGNAVSKGDQWVELYRIDCINDEYREVIIERGKQLEANVPAGK